MVRPIGADDAPLLQAGFARLSSSSKLARFGTAAPELTSSQVRYLTDVDQDRHVAVGVAPVSDSDHGLGIGRYVRLPDEPHVAEAAVAVVDEAQGQGLGTLLLAVLAVVARQSGVTTFRCYVQEANTAMLRLLAELGAVTQPEAPGLVRLDLDVPHDDEDVPATPAGRVLLAVSRNMLATVDRDFPPVLSQSAVPVTSQSKVPESGPTGLREWVQRALAHLPAVAHKGSSEDCSSPAGEEGTDEGTSDENT